MLYLADPTKDIITPKAIRTEEITPNALNTGVKSLINESIINSTIIAFTPINAAIIDLKSAFSVNFDTNISPATISSNAPMTTIPLPNCLSLISPINAVIPANNPIQPVISIKLAANFTG